MNDADRYDPVPETVADALGKWDAGEAVFTVSVGGLGPGYEQCIQILAFEIMRDHLDDKWPTDDESDEAKAYYKRFGEDAVRRLDPQIGFSGAQVGAAKNLAACVLRRGYRTALRDPAVSDRLIQVSRKIPQAPEPAVLPGRDR